LALSLSLRSLPRYLARRPLPTVALVNAILDAVFPDPAFIDPYLKAENAPDPALLQQQEDNNQRQALKNIFTTFSTMAIAAPVYLYHWRQARKTSN
jgi:hypothetical protein